MSNKIRAAVVGYGNIGKAAVEALRMASAVRPNYDV